MYWKQVRLYWYTNTFTTTTPLLPVITITITIIIANQSSYPIYDNGKPISCGHVRVIQSSTWEVIVCFEINLPFRSNTNQFLKGGLFMCSSLKNSEERLPMQPSGIHWIAHFLVVWQMVILSRFPHSFVVLFVPANSPSSPLFQFSIIHLLICS